MLKLFCVNSEACEQGWGKVFLTYLVIFGWVFIISLRFWFVVCFAVYCCPRLFLKVVMKGQSMVGALEVCLGMWGTWPLGFSSWQAPQLQSPHSLLYSGCRSLANAASHGTCWLGVGWGWWGASGLNVPNMIPQSGLHWITRIRIVCVWWGECITNADCSGTPQTQT